MVGRIAGLAREHVVCRDVDEEDVASRAQCCKGLGCCNIQSSGAFWVIVALVGESVRGTVNNSLRSLVEGQPNNTDLGYRTSIIPGV